MDCEDRLQKRPDNKRIIVLMEQRETVAGSILIDVRITRKLRCDVTAMMEDLEIPSILAYSCVRPHVISDRSSLTDTLHLV